jgi:hypothetical protein
MKKYLYFKYKFILKMNTYVYNFVTNVLQLKNPQAIKMETYKIMNYIQIGKYVNSELKGKPKSIKEYLKQYKETIRPTN